MTTRVVHVTANTWPCDDMCYIARRHVHIHVIAYSFVGVLANHERCRAQTLRHGATIAVTWRRHNALSQNTASLLAVPFPLFLLQATGTILLSRVLPECVVFIVPSVVKSSQQLMLLSVFCSLSFPA